MHELLFRPAAFRGERFDDRDDELSTTDRLALAREVVAALVNTGVRDAARLTNTAFFVRHPERDFAKRIDPATEAHLAAEWKQIQASIVMPALGAPIEAPTSSVIASPAGGTVLLVGDSHTVGHFGKELERLLEAGGARVERHAVIGSAVNDWLPKVPALLAEHQPSTVIVALGANMHDYSATGLKSHVGKMVRAIRSGAPRARLVWVGRPRRKPDTEETLQTFNKHMRAGLDADTTFIDSAPLTPVYRGGDKDHYNEPEAKAWARGVYAHLR